MTLHSFLRLLLTLALIATGPLAPWAEASSQKDSRSFWENRRRAAARTTESPQAGGFALPALPPPVERAPSHWFRVKQYVPVFGPRAWRRGKTLVPFVTLIQDAHGNESAQWALSQTLEEWAQAEKNKPLLVCVEGAWGPLSLDFLRRLIPANRLDEMALELLRRGLISGEEHRALLNTRLQIVGVENRQMHEANTSYRRAVAANRSLVGPWLRSLSHERSQIKDTCLTPFQKTVVEDRDAYLSGQKSFAEHLQSMKALWGSKEIPEEFPGIRAMIDSLEFKKNAETIRAANKSKNNSLDPNAMHGLLKKTLEQMHRHQKSAQKLTPSLLTHEEQMFYSKILDQSFQKILGPKKREASRQGLDLISWIDLHTSLAQLKITPALFSELSKEKTTHPWKWAQETATSLSLQPPLPSPPLAWAETEKLAVNFYRMATLRNFPLVQGTLEAARKANADNVVLIAGGFHTPGIRALLRQEGVMHEVLSPQFPPPPSTAHLRQQSLLVSDGGRDRLQRTVLEFLRLPPQKTVSSSGAPWIYFFQKHPWWIAGGFFVFLMIFLTGSLAAALEAGTQALTGVGMTLSSLVPLITGVIFGNKTVQESLEEQIKTALPPTLDNSQQQNRALSVLGLLHTRDHEDSTAAKIFEEIPGDITNRWIDLAKEDPRWALEVAHVLRGFGLEKRKEVLTILRQQIPQGVEDFNRIIRIFENLNSDHLTEEQARTLHTSTQEIRTRHIKRFIALSSKINHFKWICTGLMEKRVAEILPLNELFSKVIRKKKVPKLADFNQNDIRDFAPHLVDIKSSVEEEIRSLQMIISFLEHEIVSPSPWDVILREKSTEINLESWMTQRNKIPLFSKTAADHESWKKILAAMDLLNRLDADVQAGIIEHNVWKPDDRSRLSSVLDQPEFKEAFTEATRRIQRNTAPVTISLPWGKIKEDFLCAFEIHHQSQATASTATEARKAIRLHTQPLFSLSTYTEIKDHTSNLMEALSKSAPTIVVIDLDELALDLENLPFNEKTAWIRKHFVEDLIDSCSKNNRVTCLFLTSENNHTYYLPEELSSQVIRIPHQRETMELTLLETLAQITRDSPQLTVDGNVVPYLLDQIFGESSLTETDACQMLSWLSAQKSTEEESRLTVADVRSEVQKLPPIDKLPLTRRVRVVGKKVTPQFREALYKMMNALIETRQSSRSEASRLEEKLNTLLGLFFCWRNPETSPASRPFTDQKLDSFRAEAKARFKKKYIGLDGVFDQLFDRCVLPRFGPARSPTAPPLKIPLLYGPTGVGKTSVGHALAEMLGADEAGHPFYKFAEFSLSGQRDGSVITGFSSSYSKSTTGVPLQLLRQAGTDRVVLLIDEIDKSGDDPLRALVNLLNPLFIDDNIGAEFGINTRNIQFVFTANSIEFLKKHPQLANLVEIIHVPNYDTETLEKIAQDRLLREVLEEESLTSYVTVSPDFVPHLLRNYPEHKDPRSLKNMMRQILAEAFDRHLPLHGSDFPVFTAEPKDIEISLGSPSPQEHWGDRRQPVGTITMLATGYSHPFFVTTKRAPNGKNQLIAGPTDDQFKNSVTLAIRMANSFLKERDATWMMELSHQDIEKAGNSGGLAMCLAMISAQTNKILRPGFAITGALRANNTLQEVGEVDQKILTGHACGLHSFLLPKENEARVLDAMLQTPSLAGVALSREKDGSLKETLVFPCEAPSSRANIPPMPQFRWAAFFDQPPRGVSITSFTLNSRTKGWKVEGSPTEISQWLGSRPILTPTTATPVYFFCSTLEEAVDFGLVMESELQPREQFLSSLCVLLKEPKEMPSITDDLELPQEDPGHPKKQPDLTAFDGPKKLPAQTPRPPRPGRNALLLPNITPGLVEDSEKERLSLIKWIIQMIDKGGTQHPWRSSTFHFFGFLTTTFSDFASRVSFYRTLHGKFFQVDTDSLGTANQYLSGVLGEIESASGETRKELREAISTPGSEFRLVMEVMQGLPKTGHQNAIRESWAHRRFLSGLLDHEADLHFSWLAIQGAIKTQEAIQNGILLQARPLSAPVHSSDSLQKASKLLFAYLQSPQEFALVFTVEEKAKPFFTNSLHATFRDLPQRRNALPPQLLEINSHQLLSEQAMEKKLIQETVKQARAAGDTALVIDLDELLKRLDKKAGPVLGEVMAIAKTLRPDTRTIDSFLPLPLIFVGSEESYYRASEICPLFDTRSLMEPVKASPETILRRKIERLAQRDVDAVLQACSDAEKKCGLEVVLDTLDTLSKSPDPGAPAVTIHPDQILPLAEKLAQERKGSQDMGSSLRWIGERIELVPDESIRRMLKTLYSKLKTISPTESEFSSLKTYLERVALFHWEQLQAIDSSPETLEQLRQRLQFSQEKFSGAHVGFEEVSKTLRLILQKNWRRDQQGLPPTGNSYLILGPPETRGMLSFDAIASALTYPDKEPMTPYGMWRIHMGKDDVALNGLARTYTGADVGSLYKGTLGETGLRTVFVVDVPGGDEVGRKGIDMTNILLNLVDQKFRKLIDNYIGFPVPIGPTVIFVLSDRPLHDYLMSRLSVIQLPALNPAQLIQLGQARMIRDTEQQYGLPGGHLLIDDDAMEKIANHYAGGDPQKLTTLITGLGPLAMTEYISNKRQLHVTLKNLEDFLGRPQQSTALRLANAPRTQGEALTFRNGALTAIRAVLFDGETPLSLDQSPLFGDPLMKESAERVLRIFKNTHGPTTKTGEIYLEKEGPASSGISSPPDLAMYMAIHSLINEETLPDRVAYLGRLQDNGSLLRISSPEEIDKAVSNALKFKINRLVLPEENKDDLLLRHPARPERIQTHGGDILKIPQTTTRPWKNLLTKYSLELTDKTGEVQVMGSRENMDAFLAEEGESLSPKITFQLLKNIDELTPKKERGKPNLRLVSSLVVLFLIANFLNLTWSLAVEAATILSVTTTACGAFPLVASLLTYFIFISYQRSQKETSKQTISDLLRLASVPNTPPALAGVVHRLSQSETEKISDADRAAIFASILPQDFKRGKELRKAVGRLLKRARKDARGPKTGFVFPHVRSFLEFLGMKTAGNEESLPVITFDWESLQKGETALFLDRIKKNDKTPLAFIATEENTTNQQMRAFVEAQWPHLKNTHPLVFVGGKELAENNLTDGEKRNPDRIADYIAKTRLSNAPIHLRVLVSANYRSRWAGLLYNLFPLGSAYRAENLLGAFYQKNLIFCIQA